MYKHRTIHIAKKRNAKLHRKTKIYNNKNNVGKSEDKMGNNLIEKGCRKLAAVAETSLWNKLRIPRGFPIIYTISLWYIYIQ